MVTLGALAAGCAPPPEGKARLACIGSDTLRPATVLLCALGRNYVTTEGLDVVVRVGAGVGETHPGAQVTFLDAGTRSGGPLWPHRSHNDGRQIDLALFYETVDGEALARPPYWLGYGAYEPRRPGERDPCPGRRRPFDLGDPSPDRAWRLDEARTTTMIDAVLAEPSVRRIFLAPHLSQRLGYADHPKVRFAGCNAARHDDHIHIDLY